MARDGETTNKRAWLALSCTRDGTIVQVLRDDLGVAKPGARLSDIVDDGSTRKTEAFLTSLNERGTVVGWLLNVPSADAARPMNFTGAACRDDLLVVATSDSETLDNHLYEELSRLNNELINRERELARKSAALERVSAQRSRVVAIAAHDLRNPLTVIAAYADLIRADSIVHGEHAQYIEEISRSAHYMMSLVEEMLESSRVESGHVDVDLRDVDLVAAASHAATINVLRAERKEITIGFEPRVEQAIIRADPVKLRQIINNLTVNAIKFSPSRAHVTIRVHRDGKRAVLEIEDHGIGIPREQFGTIFEPYKTLGPTGTAGETSTGLGLAIVKQLAELHRAAIEVESEVGRGSVFRVSFPISESAR
jgi:two-component system, OmpR family, sensor kinase